jgi:hypothetical protein
MATKPEGTRIVRWIGGVVDVFAMSMWEVVLVVSHNVVL